ncbi:ribonuclease H-like domain-containing protein [Tanacetum coccineum]
MSRSSAEAEYRGVANVVAETAWIRNLLCELHTPLFTATLVYCDNVSTVYMSANLVQHQRTKHIEIDIHFVRDFVASGQVRVLHVPSRFQYADIFTKGLPTALFIEFRSSLNVRRSPAHTEGGAVWEAPWAQDRIHEGKLNRTIDTTLIYEMGNKAIIQYYKDAMTGQEATVYFDVCPTCKRVNPPKVENVPLKEEEHTNWLEFKKLTEGKKCAMERGLSINVDHPFVSVVRDFATDAFNVVVHMYLMSQDLLYLRFGTTPGKAPGSQICITQSTPANEDEKKKARLSKENACSPGPCI